MLFKILSWLIFTVLLTACASNEITNNPRSDESQPIQSGEVAGARSPATTKTVEKEIVQPKLGSPLKDFKKVYGKPNSHYIDSYGFDKDFMFIDTEDDMVKEVSFTYAGDTFLTLDQATIEIKKFLPEDAKLIKSKQEDRTKLIVYESAKIAETFKNMYSEQEAEMKGRIFIRVSEGIKGSHVRRQGDTVSRMVVGTSLSDEREVGLK